MTNKTEHAIGCVLMAAGNAERFGENKLAAEVDGKTLVERALDAVPAERLVAVCVVTQYDEVERLAQKRGFTVVRNPHPEWGLSHTVRLGTEALREGCDAIVYLVSDQPLLRRESVEKVIESYVDQPGRIIGASHGGKRGNPCIFPKKYYDELSSLSGDVGGSAVIRRHEDDLLLCEIDRTELTDVDTKEALRDLMKWRGRPRYFFL
ncbi:MAG: nucleotidyltransferase family protein [Oscillospiraceae bacterium]|nr:nucleotidyltransferase family protein [Oscillospiraceae bacterium]